MEDERFILHEADELDRRIIERLGERQAKLDRMAEMERGAKRTNLRPLAVALSVAACLAVVFLISPLWRSSLSPLDELGIAAPSMENYRAAQPELTEIMQLIEAQRYDEALAQAEKALGRSDVKLEELDYASATSGDEAVAYEAAEELVYNSELRWTYIYLLVRAEKNKEARRQLKIYLKDSKDAEHEDEARALLEKIK
jgi:hypothetical protein